jgi:hypothetical protein
MAFAEYIVRIGGRADFAEVTEFSTSQGFQEWVIVAHG